MIFLLPPSLDELEARLRKRATEAEEKILLRLTKAKDEMKYIDDFDFSIINDSAQRAGKELREIILSRRIEKKNLFNEYERPIPEMEFGNGLYSG